MVVKEYLLYQGCKKKDTHTQHELFNKYVKVFLAIGERYTQQKDDAKDIIQESFIAIFNNIDGFNWQGKGSFVRWMKRIVTNAAVNYYKKNKAIKFISIDTVDEEIIEIETEQIDFPNIHSLFPEHVLAGEIGDEELLKCIHILPENFKIVFNMHVIDEFSHKEIAEQLEISEKTSTTRLFRARKLIQKELINLLKAKSFVYE